MVASAVDHQPVFCERIRVGLALFKGGPVGDKSAPQLCQRGAGGQVGFVLEKQALGKAITQIGLERIDLCGGQSFMAVRASRKARQIACVPRWRDDKRAAALQGRRMLRPPIRRFLTQPHHGFFGAFTFAIGGEHTPRPPRTPLRAGLAGTVDQMHAGAAIQQDAGGAQPCHAGADDGDAGHGQIA